MHDASKVALGNIPSSVKEVANVKNGLLEAGLIVRLTSAKGISVASGDGSLYGVTLGKDLSFTDRSPVALKGLSVPVLLTPGFTPTVGDKVHASNTTGMAAASGGGSTETKAVYASAVLTGVKEDGTTANAALIDMIGGV